MNIEEWWPGLSPATKDWLIQNNGDSVSAQVVENIVDAGGPSPSDVWWVGDLDDDEGLRMPDDAIDWVEAVANGETLGEEGEE